VGLCRHAALLPWRYGALDARHEARNTSTLGCSAGNCSRRWQA